jgi:hypothetical protein
MEDLTTEELGMIDVVGTETEKRMLAEIRRNRAAKAADAARIRDVVSYATYKEFAGKYDDCTIVDADWTEIRTAIADRCVEQLATPAVRLPIDEHALDIARAHLAGGGSPPIRADTTAVLARALVDFADKMATPAVHLDEEDTASLHWAREFIDVRTFSYDGAAGRMLGLLDRLIAAHGAKP